MITRLLRNATVLDPHGPSGVLRNAYILIEDDLIADIGEGFGPDDADEILDLTDHAVLPGLINGHTHLYSALALGMPPPAQAPENFVQRLERIWWVLDRALDSSSTRASFEAGLLECVQAGVTTVFDHHSSQRCIRGSLEMLAETAGRFGLNVAVAFETSDRNGPDAFEDALQENHEALQRFKSGEHVRPFIGLHASFTLSDDSLKKVRDLLDAEPASSIHIHLAEDAADVEDAKAKGYRSPVERLDRFGLLGPRSLLAHGVHCDEEDAAILKERDVLLVHNPTSNANNRVGRPSVATLKQLEAGIGTDGMQADVLREVKEGTLAWSGGAGRGNPVPDLTEMLLKNNPRIAERIFGRPLGHIAVGQPADLAIFHYMPRTPIRSDNAAGHILFGIPNRPKHVLTRGRFRVRDCVLQGLNERTIRARAREEAARLWTAMAELSD